MQWTTLPFHYYQLTCGFLALCVRAAANPFSTEHANSANTQAELCSLGEVSETADCKTGPPPVITIPQSLPGLSCGFTRVAAFGWLAGWRLSCAP
eukprot:SAG11_NODE_109_length_16381_cov_48.316546_3_plen_95_part_00